MIGQPNLDRFSWRGPNEKYPVNVIPLPMHECEVCGRRVSRTERWSERDVCEACIKELSADYSF